MQRSYHYSKIVLPKALSNVLSAYAHINKKVEYCQGMNYIAGFFLLITNNEYLSLKLMHRLFEKYQLQDIYIDDLPLLNEQLYKFDRLINIMHPHIGESFMINKISANLISSNWFMTIFTQCMQHNKNDKPTPFLIKIWDYFLLDGWKAIFKTALFIIGELKNQLIDMRIDKIMEIFTKVSNAELLHDEINAKKFESEYTKIKVTGDLLKKLNMEYMDIQNIINNCLKKN